MADLLVSFDKVLSDFSIMYSCQELGCDDAATMRVTAYFNGAFVGTNTKTASFPGTWPVDTLRCSFANGFDSIVVHYDSRPPTCQDYGVIFMADNMRVTVSNANSMSNNDILKEDLIISNPINESTNISFTLFQTQNINIDILDIMGRPIKNLFNDVLSSGKHQIVLKIEDKIVKNGIYFLCFSGKDFLKTYKVLVIK